MEKIDGNYALVIAGMVAIIAELVLGVATGFDLLLMGLIFVIAGLIGMAVGSFTTALVTIAVLSIFYAFVGRRFVKSKLTIHTTKTNVDAILGKKAVVVQKITPSKAGQVKVDGEIWRAEVASNASTPDKTLDEGSEVVVDSVSGVTLTVK